MEAIHYAQRRIDFDHREPVEACAHLFQLHAETLRNEFPHFAMLVDELGDSRFSRPETMMAAHNQFASNVFFFHLRYLLFCLTHVPQTETICEIGGGYGAPARLWLLNPIRRVSRYFIVDFPESLFFAEVFLNCNFPEIDLRYVLDSGPLDRVGNSKQTVILCPIHLLEALSRISFDLVINTGSMQEMTEDWIEFWMGWLDRQDARWFYSLNYFAQPLSYMAEGGNTWSPRLGSGWAARLLRFDPAFVRQQTARNFGEMLAEKIPGGGQEMGGEARLRFNLLRHRVLDGQTLMEAMELVRLKFDAEMMFELLGRILKEMPFVPKEAYFLADHLSRHGFRALSSDQQQTLSKQFDKLKRLRATGQENTYSA